MKRGHVTGTKKEHSKASGYIPEVAAAMRATIERLRAEEQKARGQVQATIAGIEK